MQDVALVSALRTPIGAFGGKLKNISVYKLASHVLNATVKNVGLNPDEINEVILGQSYQNGECANGARMALLDAGWSDKVTGIVIDRRCCSGLDAICLAAMKIQTENADLVIAGGMESMSQVEFYIPGSFRWGIGGDYDTKFGFMPRGHGAMSIWGIPLYDRIQRARVMSQPIERYGELNSMISWAETAAREEGITREEADNWAVRSHKKAIAATDEGKFSEEIVPVEIPQRKSEPEIMKSDETPRRDSTLEKLAKLRPIYSDGICTAGNSSSENDGAASILMMSKKKCLDLGLTPLAVFRSSTVTGSDPTLTYPAVPSAVNKSLKKIGMSIDQMDLIEIQEAFAAQCLADAQLMNIHRDVIYDKVNVNGSGISLGHPIGATGAMRLVTLLHEMKRTNSRWGLETICGGGGLGICAIFERP